MKFVVVIFICFSFLFSSVAHASVKYGDTGSEVKIVQEHLKWYGYSIEADGIFGKQTLKAVKAWQKANGLKVDGIAGSITQGSLAIRGDSVQVTTPPAAPIPIFGSLCEEMAYFIQHVGLPGDFNRIGKRESGCQNDAPPTVPKAKCCRGWFAIEKGNINAPGYKAGAAACGINDETDYYGTSYEQKLASACFAKVLYDVSGMTPWAT